MILTEHATTSNGKSYEKNSLGCKLRPRTIQPWGIRDMRASEIIELLAMAIDGKGIPGDMPSTEDLLWAYFHVCEEAGRIVPKPD